MLRLIGLCLFVAAVSPSAPRERADLTVSAERPVGIVVPEEQPLVRFAAGAVSAYIERVTGRPATVLTRRTGNAPAIRFQLRPLPRMRPDGFQIRTDADGVLLAAADPRGLKYAAYRLVREMEQHGREVRVPKLDIVSNPFLKTRELFIAEIEWHPTPGEAPHKAELQKKFDWPNWPLASVEQYVDMMDAMGYNSVMLTDGSRMVNHAGNFITGAEYTGKVRAMYRRARRNGMGTAFFFHPQEGVKSGTAVRNCPNHPEEWADMLAFWNQQFGSHGELVDRWVLHWADPGGCKLHGCTIHTPQARSNDFLSLLRARGFGGAVSFSLWALRWRAWPGFSDNLGSVVNAGVLAPEIGIAMMRSYDLTVAAGARAAFRNAGVWGWYTNDHETRPSLHVHTCILDREFDRLPDSASALLDWYSLEDNNHVLNLPSVYVGAQKLWNPRRPARESLDEFCRAVWGNSGPRVAEALQAIGEVRCGAGRPIAAGAIWPNDYLCRLGRGSSSPAHDLALCRKALQGLDSVQLDPGFVPKLPLVVGPGELLGYIRAHLEFVARFAAIRVAYDEALKPALDGRFEQTRKLMAALPALPDSIPGLYGAGMETAHYRMLRHFADTWKHRSFGDNLALHKPVTASSSLNQDPRFAPGQAVNGLLCDFHEEGWAAGQQGPAWLKIDLGGAVPVRSVRVYNRGYQRDHLDDRVSGTPSKVRVFFAEADANPDRGRTDDSEPGYRLLGEVDAWAPTEDPGAFRDIRAAAPQKARFIKLVVWPPAAGQPAGLGEVEVR